MPKEEFEQPESAGGANESELSEEERDGLIEEAEKQLQSLMDRAHTTTEVARKNRFISESAYKRLMDFLEKTNKEIAEADINSSDVNETLACLNDIANRLKLPGDIEKENNSKLLLERMEEWAEREKQKPAPKTGGAPGVKKESRTKKRINQGSFYLRHRNAGRHREGRPQE